MVRVTRRRPGPGGASPWGIALGEWLDALETLADEHEELFDTDVRERMWRVVEERFVLMTPGVDVPLELGMFSEAANEKLRGLLRRHLDALASEAASHHLDTPEQRLAVLSTPLVASQRAKHTFEDFFGAR